MSTHHKTILLVEDERLIAMAQARQLQEAGYEVQNAYSGEEAVRQVLSDDSVVDLVLMDIDLGSGMDGTEAAGRILTEIDIPVVFLSSHTEKEYVEKTDRITSYGYVVKNSGIMVLLHAITMAFRLFEARSRVRDGDRRISEITNRYNDERNDWELNRFFDLSPDPMCVLTREGTLEIVSDAWVRTLGYPAEQLVGHSIYDFLHHEDIEPTRILLQDMKTGDYAQRFVNRYRTVDGEYRSFSWNVTMSNEGKVYAAARDVTDELSALSKVAKNEERLNLALKNTNIGVWDWDITTGYVWFSEEWYTMLGFVKDDISNSFDAWRNLWHPDDAERIERVIDEYQAGIRSRYEVVHRLKQKDGNWRWVMTRGSLLRDAQGTPYRWIGTNTDISKRKRIEEELQQALRRNDIIMKELQHRVKNNLNMVMSLISIVEPKVNDEEARHVLQDTRNRVRTIAGIYEQLNQKGTIERIDLASYLSELAESVVATLSSKAKQLTLTSNLEPVYVDIQTAVVIGLITNELVTNAVKHAFPERDSGHITVCLTTTNQGGYRFSVSDDGIGLPDHEQRADSSSDGQALIQMLVEQLGGSMIIQGTEGTTVSIEIVHDADTKQ
ncbi:MAG: PAS domain S-box protein [Alkalispirochaeta sp.]